MKMSVEPRLPISFPVDLRRRRIANGGWEWFFALAGTPIYPPDGEGVGVFTEANVSPAYAFQCVLDQWGIPVRAEALR